jgi:hypothetical protein
MNIYKIFLEILDKPSNPNAYRELIPYYNDLNKTNEASAFLALINKRDEKSNNSNIDQK